MKRAVIAAAVLAVAAGCITGCNPAPKTEKSFIGVDGIRLVEPDGETFRIKGTNLGHWLNPEGYIFKFGKEANSYHRINEALCQAVGEDFIDEFWRQFVRNYITADDIRYIASTGATVVRLPFHYKLLTDEPYLGMKRAEEGFAVIDSVVGWCRDAGLRLILDMHDCPGGQTGDNIDDSYGYPWLFESETSQQLFIKVVKAVFNQRRKTVRNSLRAVFGDLGGEEHDTFPLRPEVLGVDRFVDLTNWVEARLKNGETTNP